MSQLATIRDKTAIVGLGHTQFSNRGLADTELSLACLAISAAIDDAGIEPSQVDRLCMLNMEGGALFCEDPLRGPSHLLTLVVGGTETLPQVFAGGMLQLYRHPDERADVVADLSLIPSAFMEIACEMPTQFLSRRATCDVRY
jgi:hypothetical protein